MELRYLKKLAIGIAAGAAALIGVANAAPLVAAGADFLAVSNAVWGGDEATAVKGASAHLPMCSSLKAATLQATLEALPQGYG